MIKIESENQLNLFPWRQSISLSEPSAMDLFRQGVTLYYDGTKVFYFEEENKQKVLFHCSLT